MVRKFILGIAVALVALPITEASAQPATVTVAPQRAVQAKQTLNLPVNKSEVLRVSQPVGRVAVGNADIADVQPFSDQSFYVLGKSAGTTNLAVYGKDNRLLAVIDLVVGIDVEGIKAAIHAGMPGETIEVRAVNDAVSLSGVVSGPSRVTQAVAIASKFVADKDKDAKEKIINDLRVKGTQQVMLQVKVAEMQRNISKNFGFKPFISAAKPGSNSGFSLATLDPVDITKFALAAGSIVSGNFAAALAVDALEEKGLIKVLAEPNLVAMSGDTANFLAGGEFPVPVASDLAAGIATVTITFKQFGVSLAFTPTVLDGDLINLVVAPEVSQLDKQNSVTLNGFVIPAIATRRAKTTVELRDGQSFAVAGLLSSDFTDTMKGIPGIMDIPVLGALARSSEYKRQETELVIIITPKLVQPAPAGTLVAPTDSFVPPSDIDFFVMGRTEAPESGLTPQGGGLTGRHGHIIR